jgi:hypothetical protein
MKESIDHLNPNYDHAIYISVVDISHEKDKTAQISIKVFSDDISDAIFNHSRYRLKFKPDTDCSSQGQYISEYFADHLRLTINQRELEPVFINCEINGDSVWFNFTADTPDDWRKISVMGDHLMELFPTQTNIFNVSDGAHKKLFKLTSANKGLTFSFID